MMKLKTGKNGAALNGLKPEAVIGLMVVNSVYHGLGFDCELTSGTEGKHSRGSLHYSGLAFDVGIKDIPSDQREIVHSKCKEALGQEFDCILELTHIHVEYQPKVNL